MVQSNELRNVENHLRRMDTSLSRIEQHLRPRPVKAEHVSTQSGNLEEQVPLEIDWTPAPIKTEASFIRRADGKVTIVIEVVGEDADILMASIPDTPVEYLQLIAVAR
jgi:hypothetical protein